MKIVKKITFWILGVGAGLLILLAGLIIYLNLTTPPCDGFQTDFLGTDIRFPITLAQATQKYDLIKSNGYDLVSKPQRVPLLRADSIEDPIFAIKRYYIPQLDGLLFCFVDLSKSKIDSLEKSFEIKYSKKFEQRFLGYPFKHMKINDCVFLVVDCNAEYENYYFGMKEKNFGKALINCRIGFYYRLSEGTIISKFAD